jgi:hypothetical protein
MNIAALTEYHVVGGVIAAMIFWKLFGKIIDAFWTKTTASNYITREDCEKCSKSREQSLVQVCADVKAVKEILLLVAGKTGIAYENLKDLVG